MQGSMHVERAIQAGGTYAGARTAGARRSSCGDGPSMVGRNRGSTEIRRSVPPNHLAVKHRIWHNDCPAMVGQRPKEGDVARKTIPDGQKAKCPRSKKAQCLKSQQLSQNDHKVFELPGQLLASLEEAEDLSKLRENIRDRLKSHIPGSAFISLKQLKDEFHRPKDDGMSLERFQQVAQEELMAMTLAREDPERREFQLAYTNWHKERDQSRQKEECNKFEKYLDRQQDDIMHRREKVIVVEEATNQYLDRIMQRKARKFWPTSCFMREMNMQVKKKLARQKLQKYNQSGPEERTRNTTEPAFSAF